MLPRDEVLPLPDNLIDCSLVHVCQQSADIAISLDA
jgi:hypothetical protein